MSAVILIITLFWHKIYHFLKMKQQPSMPPRTYWVSFFVCVCSRTLMLTRLASIKCHILWSNFNGIVATMATPMNYIVVFLCHMLRVCAAYDIVIIILLCGCCCRCSFIFWISIFDFFFFIIIEVSFSRSLIRALVCSVLIFFGSSRWC